MLTLRDYTDGAKSIRAVNVNNIDIVDTLGFSRKNELFYDGVLFDDKSPAIGVSAINALAQNVALYVDSLKIYETYATTAYLAEFSLDENVDEKIVVVPESEISEKIARDSEKRTYGLRVNVYRFLGERNDSLFDQCVMKLEFLIDAFRNVLFSVGPFQYAVDDIELEQLFDVDQYGENFMFCSSVRLDISRFH